VNLACDRPTWYEGSSIAVPIEQALHRLFAAHDAGRRSEHLNVAVCEEIDIPAFPGTGISTIIVFETARKSRQNILRR